MDYLGCGGVTAFLHFNYTTAAVILADCIQPKGPILLLPLAPCLLLSVLEVFWAHFGFKKKKKGCPLPLDLYPYLDDSD